MEMPPMTQFLTKVNIVTGDGEVRRQHDVAREDRRVGAEVIDEVAGRRAGVTQCERRPYRRGAVSFFGPPRLQRVWYWVETRHVDEGDYLLVGERPVVVIPAPQQRQKTYRGHGFRHVPPL